MSWVTNHFWGIINVLIVFYFCKTMDVLRLFPLYYFKKCLYFSEWRHPSTTRVSCHMLNVFFVDWRRFSYWPNQKQSGYLWVVDQEIVDGVALRWPHALTYSYTIRHRIPGNQQYPCVRCSRSTNQGGNTASGSIITNCTFVNKQQFIYFLFVCCAPCNTTLQCLFIVDV